MVDRLKSSNIKNNLRIQDSIVSSGVETTKDADAPEDPAREEMQTLVPLHTSDKWATS